MKIVELQIHQCLSLKLQISGNRVNITSFIIYNKMFLSSVLGKLSAIFMSQCFGET